MGGAKLSAIVQQGIPAKYTQAATLPRERYQESASRSRVDETNLTFAGVMEKATMVGLILLAVTGFLYFIGVHDLDHLSTVTHNWNKPASEFWSDTTQSNIEGVGWFEHHLGFSDTLCMLCVGFLGLVPLMSIAMTLPKAVAKYRMIFTILTVEFIAIILDAMMFGGGG